jgi:Rrf2 family protein
MKLITKDTDYAFRALALMAKDKNKLYNVKEISESINISLSYLRKLFQILNREKILISTKGKGGGFKLNKRPAEIFLKDLIRIFQGGIEIKHCFIRSDVCPNESICILSRKLSKVENFIKEELYPINLEMYIKQKLK